MNYYTLSVLFSIFFHQSAFGNNDFGLCDSTRKSQADTTVFTVVEVPPEFPGGIEGLKTYIRLNSRLPTTTKMGKKTVAVDLKLLVERDGRVSAVEIVRVSSSRVRNQEKYDQEARRLALDMPRWRPGSQDGKRLRCYALVPILFKRGF